MIFIAMLKANGRISGNTHSLVQGLRKIMLVVTLWDYSQLPFTPWLIRAIHVHRHRELIHSLSICFQRGWNFSFRIEDANGTRRSYND